MLKYIFKNIWFAWLFVFIIVHISVRVREPPVSKCSMQFLCFIFLFLFTFITCGGNICEFCVCVLWWMFNCVSDMCYISSFWFLCNIAHPYIHTWEFVSNSDSASSCDRCPPYSRSSSTRRMTIHCTQSDRARCCCSNGRYGCHATTSRQYCHHRKRFRSYSKWVANPRCSVRSRSICLVNYTILCTPHGTHQTIIRQLGHTSRTNRIVGEVLCGVAIFIGNNGLGNVCNIYVSQIRLEIQYDRNKDVCLPLPVNMSHSVATHLRSMWYSSERPKHAEDTDFPNCTLSDNFIRAALPE